MTFRNLEEEIKPKGSGQRERRRLLDAGRGVCIEARVPANQGDRGICKERSSGKRDRIFCNQILVDFLCKDCEASVVIWQDETPVEVFHRRIFATGCRP